MSGRARKGNIHLRTTWSAPASSPAVVKGSYLKDKFHRLKARRGGLRAALAIAHKILVSAYLNARQKLALSRHPRSLSRPPATRTPTVANLKRRLERLGYRVTLEPNALAT